MGKTHPSLDPPNKDRIHLYHSTGNIIRLISYSRAFVSFWELLNATLARKAENRMLLPPPISFLQQKWEEKKRVSEWTTPVPLGTVSTGRNTGTSWAPDLRWCSSAVPGTPRRKQSGFKLILGDNRANNQQDMYYSFLKSCKKYVFHFNHLDLLALILSFTPVAVL